MAAIYGTGTMFYGWRRHKRRTASATKWLSLLYLPILPLGRFRVRLPKPPKKGLLYGLKEFLKLGNGYVSTVAWAPVQFEYRAIRRERLSLLDVMATYFKTYMLLPAAFVLPLVLAGPAAQFLDHTTEFGFWTIVAGMLAGAIYWMFLIAWVLNRARYGPLTAEQ